MFQTTALLLLFLAMALPAQTRAGAGRKIPDEALTKLKDPAAFWRQARNCGPNCLYVAAVHMGHDPVYADILRHCRLDENGCSISDLVRAASAQGIQAVAIRASADQLIELRQPVILHVEASGAEGHAEGHFVLAQFLSHSQVIRLDGSSGLCDETEVADLLRTWTGHAIALHPPADRSSLWGTGLGLLLGGGLGAGWRRLRRRRAA